jgi:hypothetical protein
MQHVVLQLQCTPRLGLWALLRCFTPFLVSAHGGCDLGTNAKQLWHRFDNSVVVHFAILTMAQ